VRLKLIFSPEIMDKPILSDIILKTKVPINILVAKVGTAAWGEIIIDVKAEGKKLKSIIALLRKAKVEVSEITRILEIDYDKCVACGACVSPCPVKAIKQNPDWSIEFDEEKCIRCQICIYACPTQAIKFIG
jgi:ferredoxin